MSRRDILHRLAGITALLGAGISALLHRELGLAEASGLATGLEAAVGLLTFALASLGMLLVIGGAKFRDRWRRACERAGHGREERTAARRRAPEDEENRRCMAAAANSVPFAGLTNIN